MFELEWEKLEMGSKDGYEFLKRAKTEGGWLIWLAREKETPDDRAPRSGLLFHPDPDHTWDGRFRQKPKQPEPPH